MIANEHAWFRGEMNRWEVGVKNTPGACLFFETSAFYRLYFF